MADNEEQLPRALYSNKMNLPGFGELEVHVLDNGLRIISEEDFLRFMEWLTNENHQTNS